MAQVIRMMRVRRAAAAGVLLASLLACAAPKPESSQALRLRLTPASLGTTLALQQQLTATVGPQSHRLDVLLEADKQAVRMAVVGLGQTVARLEWDGATLTQSRAPWWPEAVTAERILDDLQLMLWPPDAIRAALPAGWALESSPSVRILKFSGAAVARVTYDGPHRSELVHLREGYRLQVESRALETSP